GKRYFGDRVDDRRRDCTEIAGALLQRRYERGGGDRLTTTRPFIGEHPEQFVSAVVESRHNERSAGDEPELVPSQRINRGAEGVPGVESLVAQELEERGVKLVRAPLRHHIDHRAGIAAKLSLVVGRLDTELAQ